MNRPDYFHNKPEVNINLLFNMIQACRAELSIMKYKPEYKDTKDTELVNSAIALAKEAKEVFDYVGKGGGNKYANEPKVQVYEIWSEGYVSSTGYPTSAFFITNMPGTDFKDACKKFANQNAQFRHHFDDQRMTYWGCRLFDNEVDARKSFG